MLPLEERVANLITKLTQRADHPTWQEEEEDGASSLVQDVSTITSRIQRGRGAACVMIDGRPQYKRVNRIARIVPMLDLAQETIVNSNSTTFEDQLEALQALSTLGLAPNTSKVREYAERNYLMFWEDMNQDPVFKEYQSVPFPIKKATFLLFLFKMRVEVRYSYKTVRDTFANSLSNHLRDTNRGDPKKEFGIDIQNILRAILRKYGNESKKVAPLLNQDLRIWCSKLNFYSEAESRLIAVLLFGRASGQRVDTYAAVTLRHLKFFRVNSKLACIMKIVKDKVLLSEPREQTIYGTGTLSSCPVLALLWYLYTKRCVFHSATSFTEFIENGSLSPRDECLDWPMFAALGNNTKTIANKELATSMKRSAHLLLTKRYSPRSLRSGCVCQFLINSIQRKKTIDGNDFKAIQMHIGWRDDKSMSFYIRTAQTRYQHIQSLLDPDLFSNPFQDINALIHETTGEGSTSATTSECAITQPKKKRHGKRRILDAVTSVRWRKMPREMKVFILNNNERLKNHVETDTSGKNYHWTSYWQKVLLDYAPSLQSEWDNIPELKKMSATLKRTTTIIARDKLRNSIQGIKRAFVLSYLIDKWESGDHSVILSLTTHAPQLKSSQPIPTTDRQLRGKRKQRDMGDGFVEDFDEVRNGHSNEITYSLKPFVPTTTNSNGLRGIIQYSPISVRERSTTCSDNQVHSSIDPENEQNNSMLI